MRLDDITPVILTFNEAPNIGRTLERLSWARPRASRFFIVCSSKAMCSMAARASFMHCSEPWPS